jgi:hypothetical protein
MSSYAAPILLRLAAQNSTGEKDRADLEKEVIAYSKAADASAAKAAGEHKAGRIALQRSLIEAFGDIGSIGRLSEEGQFYLLKLLREHAGLPPDAVAAEEAMRRLKPKSKKLVDTILGVLADPKNNNQAFRPHLIVGLRTETGKNVVKALIGLASDTSNWQDVRKEAVLALFGGRASYKGYPRPAAWKNAAIREAIEKIAKEESGDGIFKNYAVDEARKIVAAFAPKKKVDEGSLRRHDSSRSDELPRHD